MNLWAFLGAFLAICLVTTIITVKIRRKIRNFSRQLFGTTDLIGALKEVDTTQMDTPRSLNGCDSLLLPKILRDFPDFDVNLAKTYVRDELKRRFGNRQSFRIHNVVIAKYLPTAVQKTIVFQAATCHRENQRTVQKRYDLHYTYILPDETSNVAANCPNCGGVLSFGETTCSFCNSRVANVLKNTWEFTEVRES